jgi:hypothetical protein
MDFPELLSIGRAALKCLGTSRDHVEGEQPEQVMDQNIAHCAAQFTRGSPASTVRWIRSTLMARLKQATLGASNKNTPSY